MADPDFGQRGEGFGESYRKLEQLQEAEQRLRDRSRELEGSERSVEIATIDLSGAMVQAIERTRELGTVTGALTEKLGAQVTALRQSAELWERQAVAMGQAAAAGRRMPATTERAPARSATPPPLIGESTYDPSGRIFQGRREATLYEQFTQPAPRLWAQQRALSEALGPLPAPGPAPTAWAQQRALSEALGPLPSAAPRREQVLLPPAAPRAVGLGEYTQMAAGGAQTNALSAEEAELRVRKQQAAEASMREAAAQREVNIAVNQSIAAYAASSSELSRHGALTTEFIQAFARGDVTLREFSSQMTQTIGKFGGWAVAAAATYGMVDALNKVRHGATATQEGIQSLSQAIPGVTSGPQRRQAEQSFRDISTQLNEPISTVTSTMTVMARTFNNVTDAANSTRAVLLAVRLDQVPVSQAQQYLGGIARAMPDMASQERYIATGGRSGSMNAPMTGAGQIDIVNSLTALQNVYGARVNQMLPGLARFAPMAQASGLTDSQSMALIGTLTTGGLTGPQAATALMRAAGTQLYRPQAQDVMRRYDIPAERGGLWETVTALHQHLVNPQQHGYQEWTTRDVSTIANAMFGNQLGPRAGVQLLERIGMVPAMQQTVAHPQETAQQELDKVLGGVGEQFRRLGIELGNIGSELESAGILGPIQAAAQAIGLLGHVVERAISPVERLIQPFSQLPGFIKDIGMAVAAIAAVRAAGNSGMGLTAMGLASKLPGMSGLRDSDAWRVRSTLADYRNAELPQAARDVEQAARTRRTRAAELEAAQNVVGGLNQNPEAGSEDAEVLTRAQAARATAVKRLATAVTASQAAEERGARAAAVVAMLESDRYSNAEKVVLIETEQLAVARSTLDNMDRLKRAYIERFEAAMPGAVGAPPVTAAGGAGGAGGAGAAAAAAATGAGGAAIISELQSEPPIVQQGFIGAAEMTAAAPQVQEQIQQAEQGAQESTQGTMGRVRAGVEARDPMAVGSALAQSPTALMLGGGLVSMIPGAGGLGQAISVAGMGAMAAQMGGGGAARLLGRLPGAAGDVLGGARAASTLSSPLFGAGAALALSGAESGNGVAGWGQTLAGGAAMGLPLAGETMGTSVLLGMGVAAVGHLLTGGGSQQQTGASAAVRQRQANLRSYQSQISGGAPSPQYLSAWSDQFSALLQRAFGGNETTQDAEASAHEVQQAVARAGQMLKAVGVTTRTGQGQINLLTSAIGATAGSTTMRTDPYNTGQILDQAWQGITAPIQSQYQYATSVARGPGGDWRAASAAADRENRAYAAAITTPETEQRQTMADAQAAMTALRRGGAVTPTAATRARYTSDIAQARQQLARLPQEEASMAGAAPASTIHQWDAAQRKAIESRITIMRNLAGGTTGGGRGGAGNLQGLTQQWNQAWQSLQQLQDVGRGFGQQRTQDMAALASNFYQSASTWAQSAAQTAQAMAGGDVSKQLDAQLQGVNAQIAALNASHLRTLHPEEYAQRSGELAGQRATIQMQQAQENAARAAIPAANVLSQTPSWEPVQQARAQLARDTATYDYMRQHAHEFDATAIAGAYQQRNQDLLAVVQASRSQAQSINDANAQAQESKASGDAVVAAQEAVAAALRDMATALGPAQHATAVAQYQSAQANLRNVNQQRITAIGDLQASMVADPLAQDTRKLAAAQRALAQAISGHYGPDVVRSDQQQVNQLLLQRTSDYVSQRMSTIQYQQQTLQISAQGALQELEALSRLRNLTTQQRQTIGAQMYAIETSQDNTSLFDLAPAGSNIRVPTIYDIRAATAREHTALRGHAHQDFGGRPGGTVSIGGATVNTTAGSLNTHDTQVEQAVRDLHRTLQTTGVGNATGGVVNVYVASAADAPAVYDAIDRTMGSRVRSRLRSAGARGT